MKRIHTLMLLLLALPQAAMAASVTGELIDGGGYDDLLITVQTSNGRKISAYCDQKCGDWFYNIKGQGDFIALLKRSVKGKTVHMEYAFEKNQDRIAGPGNDDVLLFVKKIRIVP
jgi:hypothetical protein